MTLRITLWLIAGLLCLMPGMAVAKDVTDIAFGETKVQKAGTTTDLYRFAGGSGTTIKATLTAPGESALVLYTPAGEEMLSTRGKGSVTLEAMLPLWNVFYLGVIREDGAKPYTLKLDGEEADVDLALFSHKVGFAGSLYELCWIVPGVSKRRKWNGGGWDVATLGRQGRYVTEFFSSGESIGTQTSHVRVDGDEVTSIGADAKEVRYTISGMVGEEPGRYIGANCPAN